MDNISEVFDIAPLPRRELEIASPESGNKRISDDAQEARQNLKTLMKTAQTALEHALDMATQSDSPRAYEVLANLINTTADLNTRLIDVHAREQKIATDPKDKGATPQQVTNNNVVFTGTSAELSELIMERMKR